MKKKEGVEVDSGTEKVIEVKNVRKIYRMGSERICAVDGVSFDIYKGEFCCLLGTSGSGKSTLLNLMAGIEKTTNGEIIIKGRKIHKMSENSLARFRQRYLGFVFQSYNLMGSMTAIENVEFPLIFKKVPTKKRRRMAREMLIKVGLESRLKHRPKEMSGGQQQRVGIARAFVANPEIVFADEPTGNLDTRTTMEVMNLIKGIAKENRQTIVMVTHDRRLAEFADKIIHILDGKIQNIEIVENPSNSLPLDGGQESVIHSEAAAAQAEQNKESTPPENHSEEKIEQGAERISIAGKKNKSNQIKTIEESKDLDQETENKTAEIKEQKNEKLTIQKEEAKGQENEKLTIEKEEAKEQENEKLTIEKEEVKNRKMKSKRRN